MSLTLRRALTLIVAFAIVIGALAACRNETQNRIRRSIQDFTNVRMYITVYSYDGTTLYEGAVDGKVTRSGLRSDDGSEQQSGSYVYWYDDRGRYHQTSLPYLVSTYDRGVPAP
ncbi:hypothetical protein BH23DEI1_BH23DEI1_20600 [soil metagenome]|nr:hypothetical protein [Trueperaceae bacterium]